MDDNPPRSAFLLVVLGAASYLCLMVVWFLLPPFLPVVTAELGLSGTEAGVLAGAIPLTYVPLSLATGLVLDRIGARRGIAVGLVLVGIGGAARGAATGFPTLLAATVLLGAGGTGITFGLPKLVAGLFPARLLGTMSTVYILGSYAGVAVAFGAGRTVLGPLTGGWRSTFVGTGVAVVGFAAVWYAAATWYARHHPIEHDPSPFSLESVGRDVRRVFAPRAMQLLVVVGFAYLLVLHGLQNWIQTVLEVRGATPAFAASVAPLFVVGQAGGTLAVPPVADRLDRRREGVVVGGAAAALGVAAFAVAGPDAVAAASVLLAGFGLGGVSPLLRAIPSEVEDVGPALTATAVGLVFAVGEAGGFAGPVVVGVLADVSGSYAPGLAVLALGGIGMALAGAGLPDLG